MTNQDDHQNVNIVLHTRNGFSQCQVEEVIATLWLIAALVAGMAGLTWAALICWLKFAVDMAICIRAGFREARQERAEKNEKN